MLSVALGLAGGPAAAVDTSQWKCASCPFEQPGTHGSAEAGVAGVSGTPGRFGDYTGWARSGGYAVLAGELRYRGDDGQYGDASVDDLGLDVRSMQARGGREGDIGLRLGYAEIDHRQAQGVDLGYKRSRLDAGASKGLAEPWALSVDFRHDERDGTQRSAGSFYSSAAQLAAPVDDRTDQLALALSFAGEPFRASLAYRGSVYGNRAEAFAWTNPFIPIAGAEQGQLAQAPANQFHQLALEGAWEMAPGWRASGEVAWGRMTQDAAFLPITTNPGLVVGMLPAASLGGVVDVFDANLRVSGSPAERWRVNGSYARSVRDNRSPRLDFAAVSTDMFADTTQTRTNQPFDFTRDQIRLSTDYRGPGTLRASAGIDQDVRTRSLQEVVTTRESGAWARLAARVSQALGLTLKLARADRDPSVYGTATWITPPENPLMRKFYLARRVRETGALRADLALDERVALGLDLAGSRDDYEQSTIGRLDGRTRSVGGDVAVALSDQTQLRAFASRERARARQAGSQAFAQPDWWASTRDASDITGLGVFHQSPDGKLDFSADALLSRGRTDIAIDNGLHSDFPTMATRREGLRLHARYQVGPALSLLGTAWYEHLVSQDWHLDGVQAATVPNLLALGEPAPRHNVIVLRVALRHSF